MDMPVGLGVGDAVALVTALLQLLNQIVALADSAQRNKEKCDQLKKRVEKIIPIIRELNRQWTPDPMTKGVLESLNNDLYDARALVDSCQARRTWSRVFKTKKKARMFDDLDVRISKSMEPFHIVNTLLIVGLTKDRFFMDVLGTLLDDGACRRLPQGKKEELRSYITRLTNTENMSADATRMLERIISELVHGDGASSLRPGRNRVSTDIDGLRMEVVTLADSIMQAEDAAQEQWQNEDEIQELVKNVKVARDLTRDAQFFQLSPDDPEVRSQLQNLKGALGEANDVIVWHSRWQHRSSRITRAFVCGVDGAMRDKAHYILRLANRIGDVIDFYLYVLPVRYRMNRI